MKEKNWGLYFDWDTSSQEYYAHTRGKFDELELLQNIIELKGEK